MATRSNIGIKVDDKYILSIYCHWDGYPSYVGDILLNHYKDEAKIKKLINLGSISSLGEKVEPDYSLPHTFENPQENVTVAYMRDRGETDQYAEAVKLKDFHQNCYSYYWDSNKWMWSEDGKKYKPLTQEDCNE